MNWIDLIAYTGISMLSGYGAYHIIGDETLSLIYGFAFAVITAITFIDLHKELEIHEELVEVLGEEI